MSPLNYIRNGNMNDDDVYEKESTRPGEAVLIDAKHRNGPTLDITVALSRSTNALHDSVCRSWRLDPRDG